MAEHATLAAALLTARSEIGQITKNRTANTGKYGYSYADLPSVLEEIIPALTENGLAICQPITNVDGRPAVQTTLMHTSGESITGTVPLMCADMNDPQKVGGAITYYRRYALLGMLCLATEDDDAQDARTPRPQPARQEPRYAPQDEPPPDYGYQEPPSPRNVPQRPQNGTNGNGGGGDVITPAQVRFVGRLLEDAGVDERAFHRQVQAEHGVPLEQINKRAASALIDGLKAQAGRS